MRVVAALRTCSSRADRFRNSDGVADELLAAAQVLRERGESFDRASLAVGEPIPISGRLGAVELMLRGMGVGCLLKALWLKQGNVLVDSGQYVGVRGAGSHDLPQLASAVEFTLSVHEKDVMRRLSHFIEYGGRYPVPKDSLKLMLTRNPGGGKGRQPLGLLHQTTNCLIQSSSA